MSFFRSKQGRAQLSTIGMDDQDYVLAGIKYNIVFLGSMLVPTPSGHGSSRAENTVEKVYHEKYKAFGYGSRKICLEISADEIKIFENISGKGMMETTATFQIVDITYCNIDMKHEKAFVFIVADAAQKTYRAFVFHCDSATQARELLIKFREAFKVKESKLEATRLRSFSAPPETYISRPKSDFLKEGDTIIDVASPKSHVDHDNNFEWGNFGSFQTMETKVSNGRQRSQTEVLGGSNLLADFEEKPFTESQENKDQQEGTQQRSLRNDSGGDDEFTVLAEKRTRSFDDQARSGEGFLLLSAKQASPLEANFSFRNPVNVATTQASSKSENENLLQF